MEYLDFELEIGAGEGREYPLDVIRSPAGERHGEMRFPFTELELENHLLKLQNALLSGAGPGTGEARRRMTTPLEAPVERFGTELYDALLNDDIRTCYELSRREAQIQGKGLRIKLRVTDSAMAVLPWEYLFDSDQGEFVALSSSTPIVRTIDLPRVVQPLRVAPPLRVLGMVASPEDLPPLNVERERQRVERAITPLRDRGAVEITWLETGSWQELQRAMRKGPWHIFHFVGHGRYDTAMNEGTLALVGQAGETDELTATQMGRLLADHASLRLVLLNACEGAKGGKTDVFSGTAATLVRRGLPAVVAMQYEITDRAAIAFAQTFYESIADGLPLDASVAEARKAVSFSKASTVEWGTPVLYMQSPDGVLFRMDPTIGAHDGARDVAHDGGHPARTTTPEPAAKVAEKAKPAVEPERDPEPATRSAGAPAAAAVDSPVAAAPASAPRSAMGAWTTKPAPAKETARDPLAAAAAEAKLGAEAKPAAEPKRADEARTEAKPAAAGAATPVTAADTSAAPGRYSFAGADGQLYVDPASVTIGRRGPGGVLFREGERVIPIEDVTAVHIAPASATGRGFIQICYAGGAQVKTSYWQASKHPDTIQFTQLQQTWFDSAKQWIEYYRTLARSTQQQQPS